MRGKQTNDYGSAAVMMSLLLAALTWITILGSHYP
jgi:diacylglycerol kinase